ncbi:MAG: hypothetical protein PHF67_03155 [Candidatus Nanoarchaeia archaeon]|nr:hypothetical protein [Candidatus Nanoarchaeia archaeon]
MVKKYSELKKGLWRIFHVGSFLFITIFFILPYMVQISTYFHEKAHRDVLAELGVESGYEINLLATIPNFFNPRVTKLGVTRFSLEDYEKLAPYDKARVNLAGILSDLRFLFLIGIYLALINVYTFYKVKIKKNYNLTWIMATNWILFMWLLALVQITVSNVSYSSGDFFQLVRFISGG